VKKFHPQAKVNERLFGESLFLCGRVIFDDIKPFQNPESDVAFYSGNDLVGAFIKQTETHNLMSIASLMDIFEGMPKEEISAKVLNYPWDFIDETIHRIEIDLKAFKNITKADSMQLAKSGVHIIGDVFLGKDAVIKPGAVLDAGGGPIFLGDRVEIMPGAVIIGPAGIGQESLVRIGAKIYQGTSIGPVCRVGGEITESILQGYSNKQHDGHLGHSYIGAWCNLGAGTENSDLKNNYSLVKVQIGNHRVSSGKLFVGLFMGDHTKTGINTMFNTGSVVGVGSMSHGSGFHPRFIPSFAWSDGDSGEFKRAKFEDTVETAKIVMSRRNITLSEEEISVLKHVYDNFSQNYPEAKWVV
jgi:UDP-N-acetylglucosamine diphosphorylase/glucosamine-1-phosphate N-acetyltransferase